MAFFLPRLRGRKENPGRPVAAGPRPERLLSEKTPGLTEADRVRLEKAQAKRVRRAVTG